MRRELILVAAAAVFGLAGGYGLSVMNAPKPKLPPHPKAAFMPIPPSPEERPAALDAQWTAAADDTAIAAAANLAAPDTNATTNGEVEP